MSHYRETLLGVGEIWPGDRKAGTHVGEDVPSVGQSATTVGQPPRSDQEPIFMGHIARPRQIC
ncbi:hypothetical protein [Sporosarcina gallistercoris]|uniref:Uncharacterized protein n=1 Tax=Sporosarcina gallistercoris TaxID=2762245 RepID=A0ABR8PMH0_9BACL|nr:hypothetical protein [Sporosarcina gallistercoris]MBD7909361.1 hypothetical protein [Sporosarcina gallistercoris]